MFYGGIDAVMLEKERAMLRRRRLRRAASLSRCLLEALAALSLLSWSSARLPPAALALCTGLRHLPALLLHPLSAFLVGNAIVVTLVAKFGGATTAADSSTFSSSAAYDGHRYYSCISVSVPQYSQRKEAGEDVVYEDKALCVEGTVGDRITADPKKGRSEASLFHRTMSGDAFISAPREGAEEKQLRRTRSEAGVGAKWSEEEEENVADDGEEFRQKIEAFIARQLRFIEREEESLLLAAKATTAASVVSPKVAAGGHDNRRR